MDEDTAQSPAKVSDSPKPLSFTIDFGNNKTVDTQRQKALAEKFQKRHKRGQSLSKLEESPKTASPRQQHPLSGNLPRKSSYQSEGYFSSDEKPDRVKSANARIGGATAKRGDLTLLLKNVTTDRMTQSFPNAALPSIISPEVELKDVSSPEMDLISPFSPKEQSKSQESSSSSKKTQFSSPECEKLYIGDNSEQDIFVDSSEFDFDKSDTASDTGTYTLDADNYSEEQKARMSIDSEFKIEQVSVQRKTEEYVKSLSNVRDNVLQNAEMISQRNYNQNEIVKGVHFMNMNSNNSPKSPTTKKFVPTTPTQSYAKLSPIMSPTQNISITDVQHIEEPLNNSECDLNSTFTKIMFPSPNAKREGLKQMQDQGSVISVTSSGAFKPKVEKKQNKLSSLTKSEVQVQAYIDDKNYVFTEPVSKKETKKATPKLTATIVNVQSIDVQSSVDISGVLSANIVVTPKNVNLPPSVGGYSTKVSSTKIPSPTHMVSRPRSRNSVSSLNIEFSDCSLDTDSILKPTQNYINSLQQRLSLDSDPDSDYDVKVHLNNTAHLLKQKASHTRHNSLDDRTMNISNKLEHFQNKNLLGIDQTYSNLLNQYSQNKVIHKIQNSPNNSPIRRSSSFSTKNQVFLSKNTNINFNQKESNIRNSPNVCRNTTMQRSSSTACIKPNYIINRRGSNEHKKIDRSQFGDTESSSEEDFEKNNQKRKDLSSITNTRCNRAFSLRRARADNESTPLKCPNTPEMRRKTFQPEIKHERAISVDRKPMKTNDVQSRYLLSVSKKSPAPLTPKEIKIVPKVPSATNKLTPNRPQSFARTDSGRFSMRTSKPPVSNSAKTLKKPTSDKKQGGIRSNSSLSSREVEFQNWKRRKSYDPMKAAAEGKKKEQAKRQNSGIGQNPMTQSYTEANHSQDSSPSHSSSVHRSQSFHGTAALEQLISSEEEEDLTLSADEGFSPPTPSPCELSPARASLRHTLWERIQH
ncbi:uncharacterized protein LOC130441142 isoform X1 [Diorhabda sublineata]|uniref:uncharacterized protein LOC130441142 isoform X1 n=1 Tax=Diorhabda sublineata TaxID=1163346 RepID=UPI0024E0A917|nr:uncharacterized protein LOC130441142 isoform X1 [Diorhabda sublineata]